VITRNPYYPKGVASTFSKLRWTRTRKTLDTAFMGQDKTQWFDSIHTGDWPPATEYWPLVNARGTSSITLPSAGSSRVTAWCR